MVQSVLTRPPGTGRQACHHGSSLAHLRPWARDAHLHLLHSRAGLSVLVRIVLHAHGMARSHAGVRLHCTWM